MSRPCCTASRVREILRSASSPERSPSADGALGSDSHSGRGAHLLREARVVRSPPRASSRHHASNSWSTPSTRCSRLAHRDHALRRTPPAQGVGPLPRRRSGSCLARQCTCTAASTTVRRRSAGGEDRSQAVPEGRRRGGRVGGAGRGRLRPRCRSRPRPAPRPAARRPRPPRQPRTPPRRWRRHRQPLCRAPPTSPSSTARTRRHHRGGDRRHRRHGGASCARAPT